MSMSLHTLRVACLLLSATACLLSQAATDARPRRWLKQHPRLLFTAARQRQVQQTIQTDTLAARFSDYLCREADRYTTLPHREYRLEGGTLLLTSGHYCRRLGVLSLAWRLTGRRTYLEAVEQCLRHVCAYPDWHPGHYLDTGVMATGVALAYDWLYDALSEETRCLVRRSLYDKAISLALKEYAVGDLQSWAKRETNWNVVCNAGMVLAALAVAEDYPQEAATVLDEAARYLPNCLNHFAPDGVCYEGPNYWIFTNTYLSVYLQAVADNDAGRGRIAQLPGIRETASYFVRTLLPSGRVFRFANASGCDLDSPAFFYFSRTFGLPEVAEWFRGELRRHLTPDSGHNELYFLALPWYDAATPSATQSRPAMQTYHNDINDILVLQGRRQTEGSLFLIAKGGAPRLPHQQMDAGTFLVESEGVCWSEELGSEDYSVPGFWEYQQSGRRWNYLRNSNFGHNTVSIDRCHHCVEARVHLCEEHPDDARPSATFDMTSLFPSLATDARRTFTLLDDCTIEVRDHLQLTSPQSVAIWNLCTTATVELHDNKAILAKDGKRFCIELLSPATARFRSYPAQFAGAVKKPLQGYTLLEALCQSVTGDVDIRIRMYSLK